MSTVTASARDVAFSVHRDGFRPSRLGQFPPSRFPPAPISGICFVSQRHQQNNWIDNNVQNSTLIAPIGDIRLRISKKLPTFSLVECRLVSSLSKHQVRDIRFCISRTWANIYINNNSTQLDSQSTYFVAFVLYIKDRGNNCIGDESTHLDSQRTNFGTFVFIYQGFGQHLHL